jgi:hypothetical protein
MINDIKIIKYCLSYFVIWFQSIKKFNYAIKSTHIVMCLWKIWSQDFREFWQNTCLVNSFKKTTKNIFCNMLCEYLVRELKDLFQHMSTDYLRKVMTTQILMFRDIRKNIQRQCHVINYKQHSEEISNWQNIQIVISKLLVIHIFQQTFERDFKSMSESSRKENINLYNVKLTKLSNRICLKKYKTKIKKNNNLIRSRIRDNLHWICGLCLDSNIKNKENINKESLNKDKMSDVEKDKDIF